MIKTVQIIVSGRVQGVCFRASTQKTAKQLGIQGWVKNLPDGRVKIIACAEQAQIQQLLTWCQQGPILAKVTNIDVEEVVVDELLTEFKIC